MAASNAKSRGNEKYMADPATIVVVLAGK